MAELSDSERMAIFKEIESQLNSVKGKKGWMARVNKHGVKGVREQNSRAALARWAKPGSRQKASEKTQGEKRRNEIKERSMQEKGEQMLKERNEDSI